MPEFSIVHTILSTIRSICDLPTSRQQAEQPEQQHEACVPSTGPDGLSASEDGCYLPLDLLGLVIGHLPRSDCGAVRLASKTLCQLTEPTIRSLRIKDLANRIPHGDGKWRYVTQLDVQAEPGWLLLQDSLRTVPGLQHLRLCTQIEEPLLLSLAPFLAGLTRLDLGRTDATLLPSGVSLASLRALSFGGCYGRHLSSLASFAPNVEHLYCERLSIVGSEGVELPCCTHFGASHLSVGVGGGAAGTYDAPGSYHTLFPNLKVLYRLPEVSILTGTSPLLALAPASQFEAVKGHGMMLNTSLKGQLMQMHNLKRLSLHNPLGSGMAAFQGISAFKQLQQLRMTGSVHAAAAYANDDVITAVLQEVQQLPRLQSLALPAELLCRYCSPVSNLDCLAALCSAGVLQELVFLQLRPAGPTLERPHRRFKGCECLHKDRMLEGLALVQQAAAAAAGPRNSSVDCAAVRVEGGEVWPEYLPWMNDHAAGDTVWGVYGPCDL